MRQREAEAATAAQATISAHVYHEIRNVVRPPPPLLSLSSLNAWGGGKCLLRGGRVTLSLYRFSRVCNWLYVCCTDPHSMPISLSLSLSRVIFTAIA